MKPAPFAYHRATSVEEAIERLVAHDGEPKILAGGQSLVPMMAFRLARPDLLVDVNPVRELDFMAGGRGGEPLRIGALTRTATLEDRARFSGAWAWLPELASRIAHVPIRLRGTVGGSVAHADPAAELPVLVRALDAELTCRGPAGERWIPAAEFFRGMFDTALAPDEILTELSFPTLPPGTGIAHEEFARRAGDFAIVLVIAVMTLAAGRISDVRLAVGGVASVPVRLGEVEATLLGQPPTDEAWAEAASLARRDIDPTSDIHASSAYRRHLVGVLARRALERAARRCLDEAKQTKGGTP